LKIHDSKAQKKDFYQNSIENMQTIPKLKKLDLPGGGRLPQPGVAHKKRPHCSTPD